MIKNIENNNDRLIEQPNEYTLPLATKILDIFKANKFLPTVFTPSIDGGIIIEYFLGNLYNSIEIYNEGTIVLTQEFQDKPTQITEVVFEFLSSHLNSVLNEDYARM